jgi:hypothetical protein
VTIAADVILVAHGARATVAHSLDKLTARFAARSQIVKINRLRGKVRRRPLTNAICGVALANPIELKRDQWNWLSSRVETDDNRYKFPPSSTANAGVRYTRRLFDRECSLRFDANNITNASGLTISPIYVVLPQLRRNYQLTAAIDF